AWTECASSGPPEQAADIFITNFSGSHGLFADEKSMGLDGNDDNIDAFALYDWGPEGQPNGILDRGMDQIWFSVDGVGTWGLPGTAVNTECTAGNCAGDIFWSDFTGYNLKVLDGFQLGLVEPIPAIPLQEDEDDLDGLDVALILDTDNDHIPDLVDNCPYTFNPMQGDADLNGVGDVCDTTSTTGVDERLGGADMEPGLHVASPNPFARSTELSFALAAEGHATLDIYNVSGRHMTRLVDENLAAGGHTVNWNGMDESGSAAPAGVYFARFVTDGTTETRKLILIK
ncbi:MAG: T9SS type A sorting domain-containing protein, partial [Gemmatimonadota bacterium]|nr:T9SS type A sorting domain-containing protein [Gemmatimonadota bacterium]